MYHRNTFFFLPFAFTDEGFGLRYGAQFTRVVA